MPVRSPLVLKRATKFSVADVVRACVPRCTSLRAALAMVPSFCQKAHWCVTYPSRLSGTLDRYASSIWYSIANGSIACGTDGLGGKGCTRMRPKLHLPVFVWVRFPSHWFHGMVRNLEGCAVPHRSIRE